MRASRLSDRGKQRKNKKNTNRRLCILIELNTSANLPLLPRDWCWFTKKQHIFTQEKNKTRSSPAHKKKHFLPQAFSSISCDARGLGPTLRECRGTTGEHGILCFLTPPQPRRPRAGEKKTSRTAVQRLRYTRVVPTTRAANEPIRRKRGGFTSPR